MRRSLGIPSVMLVVLASLSVSGAWAQRGGRDVTVAMFSAHRVASVSVEPLSPDAWISSCSKCAHRPMNAASTIEKNRDIYAGGPLQVTDETDHRQVRASGLWHFRARDGAVDVTLELPSERYVEAVLNAETDAGEPPESLRALAIVARTYALNGRHYAARAAHLPAELCDSTECQAMRPGPVSAAIHQAARDTAGETLWFHGHSAQVFFHEDCGGVNADASEVWPRLGGIPYLASHADPYCLRRRSAAWHAEVTLADLRSITAAEGWHLPDPIVAARVIERGPSHRPLTISLAGPGGRSAIVDAGALRFAIGRALGWEKVRGNLYDVSMHNGALIFDGKGYGHGVGLCQTGAAEMASEHKNARAILAFYFPSTSVGIGPEDSGWKATQAGPVAVRSVAALTAAQSQAIAEAWHEALRRFPPRQPNAVQPEIVFAPSVELFRQLTARPGWDAASTSGSSIVLSASAATREHLGPTLLHELLHVLVESEAGDHAPLWLREGLVEALAEPAHEAVSASRMKSGAIDAALAHAVSHAEDERAHRAAARRVREMVARYGSSTVRGWLVSGVPSGVS